MKGYYSKKLAADRLQRCYAIAPPRVKQYLQAELDFVLGKIKPGYAVLDLGCGYGRAIPLLAQRAGRIIGIDISLPSLFLAREYCREVPNYRLAAMDASRLAFAVDTFDLVACIQNGISAFHTDPRELVLESLRVARPGATALFSTYAERFWDHRLEWFRLQSAAGLLGAIDEEKTGNGIIACKDGFVASTYTPDRFLALTRGLPAAINLTEVDGSSLFCELVKQ